MKLRAISDPRVVELLEIVSNCLTALREKQPGMVDYILSRLSTISVTEDPNDLLIRLRVIQHKADFAREEGNLDLAITLFNQALTFLDPTEIEYYVEMGGLVRSMFEKMEVSRGFDTLGQAIMIALDHNIECRTIYDCLSMIRYSDPVIALTSDVFVLALKRYAISCAGFDQASFDALYNHDPQLALKGILEKVPK